MHLKVNICFVKKAIPVDVQSHVFNCVKIHQNHIADMISLKIQCEYIFIHCNPNLCPKNVLSETIYFPK